MSATGNVAYIDFNLITNNATISTYATTIKPVLITTLNKNLGVDSSNIYIFNDNDCTKDDVDRMCSYVRIVSDTTNGASVLEKVIAMQPNFRQLVYANAGRFFPTNLSFQYQTAPVLRSANNTTMTIIIIVCCVVAVLIIAGIVGYIIYSKSHNKKHIYVKSGRGRSRTNTTTKVSRRASISTKESKKYFDYLSILLSSHKLSKADKASRSRRDSAIKLEKKNQAKGLI